MNEMVKELEGLEDVKVTPLIDTVKVEHIGEGNSFNFSHYRRHHLPTFEVENSKINENENLEAEIRFLD
jgi:hypothetical protein